MESLGSLVRDFSRQFFAFALPGSALILVVIHVFIGVDHFFQTTRPFLWVVAILGYGASVAVGFALHSMSVRLLGRAPGQDFRSTSVAIGQREARFQSCVSDEVRHHHRRLVGYWQMCSGCVLASLLGAVLLIVDSLGSRTLLAITGIGLGVLLLTSLLVGYVYMYRHVHAFEDQSIELAGESQVQE